MKNRFYLMTHNEQMKEWTNVRNMIFENFIFIHWLLLSSNGSNVLPMKNTDRLYLKVLAFNCVFL